MKRITTIGILAVLVGCQPVEQAVPYHGYGAEFDALSPEHGIAFRVDARPSETLAGLAITVSDDDYASAIDDALSDAALCLGVDAGKNDSLHIVITSDSFETGSYVGGRYFYNDDPLILIKSSLAGYWLNQEIEHEFVHYLLDREYGDSDDAHQSGCYPHGTVAIQ